MSILYYLLNEIATMKQSFFDEGYLDPIEFQQLERLQDSENPNFSEEIFTLFFKDSTRQFSEIEQILYSHQEKNAKQIKELYRLIYRLKGSVASIGALKTLNEVNKMRQFFDEGNMEGIITAFEQMKIESENLKKKVEPYFKLLELLGRKED